MYKTTLLLFTLTLAFPVKAYELPAQQEWFKCETKSQCVAVKGSCGEWTAININHKMTTDSYFKEIEAYVKCLSFIDTPYPALDCQKKTCVILDKEHVEQ